MLIRKDVFSNATIVHIVHTTDDDARITESVWQVRVLKLIILVSVINCYNFAVVEGYLFFLCSYMILATSVVALSKYSTECYIYKLLNLIKKSGYVAHCEGGKL